MGDNLTMALAGAPARDPTDVLGRRIPAYVIDVALVLGVGGILLATAKYSSFYDAPKNACRSFHSSRCFQINDHVYVWKRNAFLRCEVLTLLVAFLDFVVLQTLTGATVGKLCVRLRVVDALGHPAGFMRTLGRSVLLVVDAACFLVGLIAVLSTHPRRRLGDLACGTYVVSKSDVGRLIFAKDSPAAPTETGSWRRGWSPSGFEAPTAWSPPSVTRGRESPWGKPPPAPAPAPAPESETPAAAPEPTPAPATAEPPRAPTPTVQWPPAHPQAREPAPAPPPRNAPAPERAPAPVVQWPPAPAPTPVPPAPAPRAPEPEPVAQAEAPSAPEPEVAPEPPPPATPEPATWSPAVQAPPGSFLSAPPASRVRPQWKPVSLPAEAKADGWWKRVPERRRRPDPPA